MKEGYLYHIKDDYFKLFNNNELILDHKKGKRPSYFVIKDNNILWFIPISSKIVKYKQIRKEKIKKYGYCNTILIEKIANKYSAILLQNAFPTLEKHVGYIHEEKGRPIKISVALKKKIEYNFNKLIKLKKIGINLFFTDIDKIKEIMLKELEKEKVAN